MSGSGSESEHLVFMYGTLKEKQPNHHFLYSADKEGVTFVGHAMTDKRFPLVIATDRNIPFILLHGGTIGHQIIGEVYRVNDTTMKFLDVFEGYPKIYDRKLVDVTMQPSKGDDAPKQSGLQCWFYGLSRFKQEFLQHPHYNEYLSAGDHNRPFIPISESENSKLENLGKFLFDD